MTEPQAAGRSWLARTVWARTAETPLRRFLRTETGSAALMLACATASMFWTNFGGSSYERLWGTHFSLGLGQLTISMSLRTWINSGLMALFFFVVGLEARREFDIGELRERRRVVLALFAGLAGMTVPILIYLSFNAGRDSAHGWGAAMASDTAYGLGVLALVGPRNLDRLRSFVLTISVADDVISLAVIAIAYNTHVDPMDLLGLAVIFLAIIGVRAARVRAGIVYGALGIAAWFAAHAAGVDPIVVGLAMGLLAFASPAARNQLERASDLFRLFREQPTPELARTAAMGLASAVSPNERLARLFHPWTSYLIVPLFALANGGIRVDVELLARAFTSPITLGILIGYLAGKPTGIVGMCWLVTRLSRGRLRPSVGWAAVGGTGQIAGIGFTVSLLIASLAFTGDHLAEAKIGLLVGGWLSALLAWGIFKTASRLPPIRRFRALLGTTEVLVDLSVPVDPEYDHFRGHPDAPVTVVEYGDFECPYCGQAEPVVRQLLAGRGDVRYVWRHLPLHDVHPNAQLAAEAAEAASLQGKFWEMHDMLLAHQQELQPNDLIRYAGDVGLDVERFRRHLREGSVTDRIAEDMESADLSGVSGTPTFFINGRRHRGSYDLETLSNEVRLAKTHADLNATMSD